MIYIYINWLLVYHISGCVRAVVIGHIPIAIHMVRRESYGKSKHAQCDESTKQHTSSGSFIPKEIGRSNFCSLRVLDNLENRMNIVNFFIVPNQLLKIGFAMLTNRWDAVGLLNVNPSKSLGRWTKDEHTRPGKRLQKTMERSTMLLMGKLTISTGPFSIAMLVITRG